jgi:hypothetical protein
MMNFPLFEAPMNSKAHAPTYRTWQGMKARCLYPSQPHYKYYGAKGIGFDPRWERYENFLADMGERPEGKTLDRLDSALDYTKNNCRWATKDEQLANRQMQHNNKSGVPGVFYRKDYSHWTASIQVNGRQKAVYSGKSFEEAVKAREDAVKRLNALDDELSML